MTHTNLLLTDALKNNGVSHLLKMLLKNNRLEEVMPYISHTVKLEQNEAYHQYDVFHHLVAVAEAVENRFPCDIELLLSSVLHDCAKGWTEEKNGIQIRKLNPKNDRPQDIGHEEIGAPVAYQVVKDLGYDEKTAMSVEFITKYHGIRMEMNPKKKTVTRTLRRIIADFSTSEKPFFLNRDSLAEGIEKLFDFMLCDADGFNVNFGVTCRDTSENVRLVFREVLSETAFFVSDLAVSKEELLGRGVSEEKTVEIFARLVELNISGREEVSEFLEKKYGISL